MMKSSLVTKLAVLVLALVMLIGALSAAAASGSSGDPLVTLSYLTGVTTPALVSQVETVVADNQAALLSSVDALLAEAALTEGDLTYQAVTLAAGMTLYPAVGGEVLLRSGTVACSAADPGLADTTDGTSLTAGSALTANHLYLVTAENGGITASANAKLMVRGAYTIG